MKVVENSIVPKPSVQLSNSTNQNINLSTLSDNKGLGGHPRGLTTLFFTEMWERFSYYGMRAILVLYMVASVQDGGLGFTMKSAAYIYGAYTMLVYLSSIPGGFLADRFFGARKSVFIGGSIIALGHFSLAVPNLTFFFLGLGLIILGTGLLKPNISSLVGSLYSKDDPRRDGGFSIFYMGVNIGAALSPLVCGYLAQSKQFKELLVSWHFEPHISWHFGFAAAGIGMLFGLTQYVLQGKHLAHVGGPKQKIKKEIVQSTKEDLDNSQRLSANEISRIGAIAILFFFTMLFWSVYEQGGSSMTIFADRLTKNELFGIEFPSSWYQSLSASYVVFLAPVFSWLWIKLGRKQPSSPAKFTWGLSLLGLGTFLMVPACVLAATGKVSPFWLCSVYLIQVLGELCLSPVGLSTVTKLAPKRFLSFTMGIWFLAASLGNWLAGFFASLFDESNMASMVYLFGAMSAMILVAAGILFILTPKVRKLMAGVQ